MARVIVFDTPGSGSSDRVVYRLAVNIELFADVSLAVLELKGVPGTWSTFAARTSS